MNTQSVSQMSVSQLQAAFLGLRGRIIKHARIYFRDIRCSERRADCIAEVVALCWRWFCRLAKQGKDARQFPSVLATFAARQVCCGRRLCGQLRAKDVFSERAQRKGSFRVEALPVSTRTSHEELYGKIGAQRHLDEYEERLQDNLVSPIPDQVAFRCDFPAWLTTRTERDRRLIADMGRDERTKDLSHKYGLSQARVSQLRRQYYEDWQRYCADPAEPAERSALCA